MSLAPPSVYTPGSFERMMWAVIPPELAGKITNLEEITQFAFDKRDKIIPREVKMGYRVFSLSFLRFNVAYDCGGCKNMVFGPPRIEDKNSISLTHPPLSGRKGYDIYCTKCCNHLDEVTPNLVK